MKYLLLSVITLLISTISGNVEISFMKAVPRLNNSMYCDYYFACHAEGETLQWIVNNNYISDYSGQSVGHVFTGSISTCNYTTTLLSLKPMPPGQSVFDSVLILSCQSSINFDVTCTNGLVSSLTSSPEKSSTTKAGNSIPSVKLEHVLNAANIVTANGSSCTNIFVCGVHNSFMSWQVQENSLLFTVFDSIGTVRQLIPDTTTVELQAILIGNEPYSLVAVMIVIGSVETNVTCGYSQNTLRLASIPCPTDLETTGSETSRESEMDLTESSTVCSKDMPAQVSSSLLITTVTTSIIGTFIIALLIGTISGFLCGMTYKRKQQAMVTKKKNTPTTATENAANSNMEPVYEEMEQDKNTILINLSKNIAYGDVKRTVL